MSVDTVITNCKLARHDGIFDAGLAIDQGKVVAIAKDPELPSARTNIDGQGNYIIPGVVDAHVHLEYPPGVDPQSNIQMETKACAAAGCTTIVHLLAPADDILDKAREFAGFYEKSGYVDLALSARIYNRDNIKQIRDLYDYGIINVKLLLPYKGSEAVWKGRVGGIDDGIIYLTFKEVGRLVKEGRKAFVRVHCENAEIFFKMKEESLEKGIEPSSWNEVRPRVCEAEAMRKCLYLAGVTECPIYIVHMTIKEGVALVNKARAEGVKVVAETCVQYLTLNTDNTDRVLSKVNPPIREPEDNQALWEALRDGTLNVVATDHAPVPKALKNNLWDATPGIPGAEMFLPLMLSEGVNKGRISLERLVDVCCYRPAKQFGLAPRKGTLSIGSDADLAIIDLNKEAEAPQKPVYSNSDYSIVAGRIIKGWPKMTMLRGHIIAQDGNVIAETGDGRYIPGR
ncbi:MAG: amidohydrolase family protein [Deltaproteobacteria bacterium]|nr:MAG: amidohydrolase family protein [Deltaproteobacteria bacterium]